MIIDQQNDHDMDSIVREEIVEWISTTEDQNLLEALKILKDSSVQGDWLDTLSDTDKASIEKGVYDSQRGDTLTSTEFWKRHG